MNNTFLSPLNTIDGLLWLLLLLGPLFLFQRALHKEIQSVFLLITRRPEISIALFSLLFLPGVLIHEGSHYLMAKLLGVPTGRVSLIPESIGSNRLRLGFVETGKTDIIRDAMIGSAPLLVGGLFVAYAGIVQMNLLVVWDSIYSESTEYFLESLRTSLSGPDFWLWFYLTVTVSSMMFPSESDRRAWLPVIILIVLVSGTAILFGAGPWMSEFLLPTLNNGLRGVAIVFAISTGTHLFVLIPTLFIRVILNRATGLQVRS